VSILSGYTAPWSRPRWTASLTTSHSWDPVAVVGDDVVQVLHRALPDRRTVAVLYRLHDVVRNRVVDAVDAGVSANVEALLLEPVDGVVGPLPVVLPEGPLVRVTEHRRIEQRFEIFAERLALAELVDEYFVADGGAEGEVVFRHLDVDRRPGDRVPVRVDDVDGQRSGLIVLDPLVGCRLVEAGLSRRRPLRRSRRAGPPPYWRRPLVHVVAPVDSVAQVVVRYVPVSLLCVLCHRESLVARWRPNPGSHPEAGRHSGAGQNSP